MNIIDKCEEQCKLLYIYVNRKLKHKAITAIFRNENGFYGNLKEISKLIKSFQKLVTKETI